LKEPVRSADVGYAPSMGVYLYVAVVVTLLVLPSLVFVLVNRERGVHRRGDRAALQSARVRGATLPSGAREPVSVFVEGVELQPGTDYRVQGQHVVLLTPHQPYRPSAWREFITTSVGVGFYGRGAQLDVHYVTGSGERRSSLLPVVPLDDSLAGQRPLAV
jgi:hypothetical protein